MTDGKYRVTVFTKFVLTLSAHIAKCMELAWLLEAPISHTVISFTVFLEFEPNPKLTPFSGPDINWILREIEPAKIYLVYLFFQKNRIFFVEYSSCMFCLQVFEIESLLMVHHKIEPTSK
jgi:hypothetical protein